MATKRVAAKKAAKKVASVVGAVMPKQAPAPPPPRPMQQKLINHIVFALDKSGSMAHLESAVIDVFDAQIKALAEASVELDQETRVSIYTFDHNVECIIYDTDVLRLPSIKGTYRNSAGGTSLLDATAKSIEDLKKTPELYGDHAFLLYVLTDGQEMHSRYTSIAKLNKEIQSLPENWTIATMVPDQRGKSFAQNYGFPSDNIVVWDTSAKGIRDLGAQTKIVTRDYMTARASGVRGTSNLFQMKNVSGAQIKRNLEALDPKTYKVIIARKEKEQIRDVVESWIGAGTYTPGCAYYRLEKTEKVQAGKEVLVREKKTGKVFGGDAARSLLGLPNYEVKVAPTHLVGHEIFIQSTSVNRNIFKDASGTGNVIVMV